MMTMTTPSTFVIKIDLRSFFFTKSRYMYLLVPRVTVILVHENSFLTLVLETT